MDKKNLLITAGASLTSLLIGVIATKIYDNKAMSAKLSGEVNVVMDENNDIQDLLFKIYKKEDILMYRYIAMKVTHKVVTVKPKGGKIKTDA